MNAVCRRLVVVASVVLALMISSSLYAEVRVINPQNKRGPEVAATVRKMAAANAHLRTAFERMRGRGLNPRIEDSVIVSGTAVRPNAAGTRAGTMEVVAGDGVELVFIPAYIAPGYWEGTVDARRYDPYGNLTDEYIANVVMSSPDPDTVFDVPYEDTIYDTGGGGTSPQDPMQPMADRGDKEGREPRGRKPAMTPGQHGSNATPQAWRGRWGAWGKCSLAWCTGAAVGCAAANWWNAEIAWGPCTAVGCIGGAIGCTYGTLWD